MWFFYVPSWADAILKKIKTASNLGMSLKERPINLVRQALEAGIISLDDVALLTQAESVCDDAAQVDSFTLAEYQIKRIPLAISY